MDADKKRTWMIGNSLRTDIAPAVKVGINAIHIPATSEWIFNYFEVDKNKYIAIFSLKELSKIFNL